MHPVERDIRHLSRSCRKRGCRVSATYRPIYKGWLIEHADREGNRARGYEGEGEGLIALVYDAASPQRLAFQTWLLAQHGRANET